MAQQLKRLNDSEVIMLLLSTFAGGLVSGGLLYTVLRAGCGPLFSVRSLGPAALFASVLPLLGALSPRQDAKVRRTLALEGLLFFLVGLTFTQHWTPEQNWALGILLLAYIALIVLGFTWRRRGMLSW